MKRFLLLPLILLGQLALFAQTDSVSMLPGNALDIFYNLGTGKSDTVRNNNWHLAFALRKAQPPLNTMQAATIRINDGRNVELYKSTTSISNWSTFDTSGWMGWTQYFNSDSTWDIGAFNQGRNMSNAFDYGWGQYSMSTKDVTGSMIYLIAVATSPVLGAPKALKKIAISRIVFDTMWVFTMANIDGSDSTTIKIRKSDFQDKLFAYVNIFTNAVIDREPAVNTWDLLFTRYKSQVTLFGQTLMYPVMGVLQNPNVVSARRESPDARSFTPDTSLRFKTNISQIGWDWKRITTTPGAWPVRDSISYVIKTGSNQYYRLYFTEYFSDNAIQYIKFNKSFYSILTSTSEIPLGESTLNIYPNPASGLFRVDLSGERSLKSVLTIHDMLGNMVLNTTLENGDSHLVSCEGMNPGVYFVSLDCDGKVVSRKLVID